MDSYTREEERLLKLFEEVETDEAFSDSDDSVADDNVILSDHISDSDIEPEEDAATQELPVRPSAGSRSHLHFLSKDGTKWNKHCFPKNVRTRQNNIIVRLPGVIGPAKDASTPIDCWQLFFDDATLNEIVLNTNIYIESLQDRYAKKSDVRPTSLLEIRALLGLLYLAGIYRAGRTSIFEFWSTDGTGIQMFPATMALKRFRFLMRCLRTDDIRTREMRKTEDNLAPVRDLFQNINGKCQKHYTVGRYATLDEMLWAFRGRCRFRMYIPNKPARYGIKVLSLVDSRTFYTYNMEVYCGKQPEGPFTVSNATTDVVNRMCSPLSKTRRNITMDNWFTSVPAADDLLKNHDLTIVGTLRKDKKQIPFDFFVKRPPKTSMFGFTEDKTIVSYIPKRNKNVILLSTLHHDDSIDPNSGDDTKPEIITFYNSTKCGVDTVDQLSSKYNVARNTRRWPMVIFYGLLNITGINAFVIYKSNAIIRGKEADAKVERRIFLKTLAKSLLVDYMKERVHSTYLPREIRQVAATITGTEMVRPVSLVENKRGRCAFCKDRKTRYKCRICQKFICLEHSVCVCQTCAMTFAE